MMLGGTICVLSIISVPSSIVLVAAEGRGPPPWPPQWAAPSSRSAIERRPRGRDAIPRTTSPHRGFGGDRDRLPPPPPPPLRGPPRGGGSDDGGDSTELVVATDEKINSRRGDTALARFTPEAVTTVSERVDDLRSSARKWKRKELLYLFLARIGFVLLLPLSAVFFVLSLAASLLLTAFRILTLNFAFRETSRICYAATKAMLGTIFASFTGIFLPVFAMFGLIASTTEAACEMVEPIMRIRYQRQVRKLRHLQKILTDPVLMETMEYLLRGAEAVTRLTAEGAQKVGGHVGRQVERTSWWAIDTGRRKAASAAQQVQENSVQMIETLIQSPDVQQFKESVQSKLPSGMNEWTKDQWESLRKSGLLENAARMALTALQKELKTVSSFLPYLEAIKEVRDKQIKEEEAIDVKSSVVGT